MPTFHGIVVYEIIDGGKILNGIYTNNEGNSLKVNYDFSISNEIAIRIDSESPLIDRYELSINNVDSILTGQMDIERRGVVYILRQTIDGKPAFEGFGFRSGIKHFSFSYWTVKTFSTI